MNAVKSLDISKDVLSYACQLYESVNLIEMNFYASVGNHVVGRNYPKRRLCYITLSYLVY